MTLFMFKDENAGLSLPSITITPLCRKAGAAGGSKKSASTLNPSSLPMANGVAAAFKPFRSSAGITHYDSFRKSLNRDYSLTFRILGPLTFRIQIS
jgi:hypothetical protein